MKTKIYKFLFNSAQKLKRNLGIENFEAFKKKNKRKVNRLIYKNKYDANDLIQVMKKMGMKKGSVVFIHSSMTEFYNYTGTAEELIHNIIDVIGEDGTLMMPAYPKTQKLNDEVDFDVLNSPSGAGYLSELFRKMPGVKRSINLQHSVCAYGKLAEHFTNEHHLSSTAWDQYSPYYKMSQMNTLVFALGLPYFLGTMIHCTESVLQSKYKYFQLFFTKEKECKYKDVDGNIKTYRYLTHNFARRRSKKKIIKKYFDKNEFNNTTISNLRIEMVNAKYTLDLFLQLAEKGITMYSVPSPKPYLNKEGKFIKAN